MSGTSRRVLLIELDGGSYDLFGPLAARGVIPNTAQLLVDAPTLVQVNETAGLSEEAARTSLWTGIAPASHGMLDDWRLDGGGRRLVRQSLGQMRWPTLDRLAEAAWGRDAVVTLEDFNSDDFPWQDAPADLATLRRRAERTCGALRRLGDRATEADQSFDWRLMTVRFRTLQGLQYHVGNALATTDRPGANRDWVAQVDALLVAWDDCVGELRELAAARDAAVIIASPAGVTPFRGRISVGELLARAKLLHLRQGSAAASYCVSRWFWKFRRRWSGGVRPISAVLPIDWRYSLAVSLHGLSAALVYVNTAERFGRGAPVSRAMRAEVAEMAVAALTEARHPSTGERLFADVFRTDERYGDAARRHGWPEVIGAPAAGFQVRHRTDRKERLVRGDRRRTGMAGGPGLLLSSAAGVVCEPRDDFPAEGIASTVARLLDLPESETVLSAEDRSDEMSKLSITAP